MQQVLLRWDLTFTQVCNLIASAYLFSTFPIYNEGLASEPNIKSIVKANSRVTRAVGHLSPLERRYRPAGLLLDVGHWGRCEQRFSTFVSSMFMPCRLLASNRIYPALSVHRLLYSWHLTRLDRVTFPKINIAAALGTLTPFGSRCQATRKDDSIGQGEGEFWILDRWDHLTDLL